MNTRQYAANPPRNRKVSLSDRVIDHADYHRILSAIFDDCRTAYPSRAMWDADYKSLSRCTFADLYTAWKQVNIALTQHEYASCDLLRWRPTTPKGVRGIRQLTGIFSRLEGLCDPSPAIHSWATRVSQVRGAVMHPEIRRLARLYLRRWLGRAPSLMDLVPKHGPGAVSTGEKIWDKWCFTTTYRQIDHLLGCSGPYLVPASDKLLYLNERHHTDEPYRLTVEKHPITKVIAVPKDLVKPRIISEEPLTLQYLQQGVMRHMITRLEKVTSHLHFTDQTVNGMNCRDWETWATLDMSEASDRVSRRIVRELFPDDWCRLLFALRSHFARLPDGTLVPLRCFAPMGSALCFPVEALVFSACVDAFLAHTHLGSVVCHVYGDDLLVPREYATEIMGFLREIGMVPNIAKCCYTGSFRESCGHEWFQSVDVTVVRPKTFAPRGTSNPHGIEGLLPMVGYANRMYATGYKSAAQAIADMCRFPVSPGSAPWSACPGLRWKYEGRKRWNKDLQRFEQLALVPSGSRPGSAPASYSALAAGLIAGWRSDRVINPIHRTKLEWVPIVP